MLKYFSTADTNFFKYKNIESCTHSLTGLCCFICSCSRKMKLHVKKFSLQDNLMLYLDVSGFVLMAHECLVHTDSVDLNRYELLCF